MSSLRHNAVLYSHRFDFHSAWRCPVQSSYTKSHNSTQHIATTSKWCSIPNHPIFRCPWFASCDIEPGALFLRSLVIYKHDHQHLWGNTTRWSCRTISGVGNQKKKTKSHDSVGLLCPTGGYFFLHSQDFGFNCIFINVHCSLLRQYIRICQNQEVSREEDNAPINFTCLIVQTFSWNNAGVT